MENGYYYHFKHDPTLSINNYAYEVVGIGQHTEDNTYLVIYRPLYHESRAYSAGKLFDIRPLEMFSEKINRDGKNFKRFEKITDQNIISALEKIKREMYS